MAINDDISMFYGAKSNIFENASILRENMTLSETLLWEKLKNRKTFPYKIRRQHPIDIFIVDFYCHKLKLVIEVDGGYHLNSEQKEYDYGRTGELEYWGIKVIQFNNDEIISDIKTVLSKIKSEIQKRELEIQNDLQHFPINISPTLRGALITTLNKKTDFSFSL